MLTWTTHGEYVYYSYFAKIRFVCRVGGLQNLSSFVSFRSMALQTQQNYQNSNSRVQKYRAAYGRVQKVKPANSRVQKYRATYGRVQKGKTCKFKELVYQ